MLGPVSVVLQLGNVVVEIQRVWIRVSTANSHVFAVQNLLHRNFHLLARVSILRTPHQHATNGHEPKFMSLDKIDYNVPLKPYSTRCLYENAMISTNFVKIEQ